MEKKRVRFAFIAAFLVFVIQLVDVFYIHSTGSLFASNVVARLVGIVIVIAFSVAAKSNIRKLCFKTYHWISETINGTIIAVVPIAIVFALEYLILRLKDLPNIALNIDFPNTNDAMSMKGKLFAIGVFAASVFLQSIFKELVFRGYMITQLNEKYGIRNSIIIQAVLYMFLLVPTIANMIYTGRFRGYGVQMAAFIIVCNLIVDFISGIKWGIFFRVSGNVWMSTADHFVNNMVLTCFSIYSDLPMKWFVIQAVLVQIISFVLFLPIYFKRDRLNEEIAAEVAVQRELAGMTVDNYSPSPVRHYIENRYRTRQEEMAKKRNIPVPPDRRIMFPSDFEEPVSLSDMRKNAGNQLFETVPDEEEDVIPEQSDDIVDIDSVPSEMSKSFFDRLIDRSVISEVYSEVNDETPTEPYVREQSHEKAEEPEVKAEKKAEPESEPEPPEQPEEPEEKPEEKTEEKPEEKSEEKPEENTDSDSGNGGNISRMVQGYFNDNFNRHTFKK